MRSQYLASDCAMNLAMAAFGIVAEYVREDQRKLVFDQLYQAAKDAITAFEERSERIRRRLGQPDP